MGATRYDYPGREEFFDKLIHVSGISEGGATAYVVNILRPEIGPGYKTAKKHWEFLMERPLPTQDDVTKTPLYSDENPAEEEASLDEESSEEVEHELSYDECLELIEELQAERLRLFDERKSLKGSIHLHKSNVAHLKEHINSLTNQLNKKTEEAQHLRKLSDSKDHIIAQLEKSSTTQGQDLSQQVEMLKAVIADQAILIYALHQSKGCDHA